MEAARIQKVSAATGAANTACLQEVISKPEFAAISTKIYLNTDSRASYPLGYLTNQAKPTKAEISSGAAEIQLGELAPNGVPLESRQIGAARMTSWLMIHRQRAEIPRRPTADGVPPYRRR